MPIDSRMYLDQQGIDFSKITEGLKQGAQIKADARQQAAADRTDAFNQKWQKSYIVDDKGNATQDPALRAEAMKFAPDLGIAADRQKQSADSTMEEQLLKLHKDKAGFISQALGGVKDDNDWRSTRPMLIQAGVKDSDLPQSIEQMSLHRDGFNTDWLQQHQKMGLDSVQQFDQHMKERQDARSEKDEGRKDEELVVKKGELAAKRDDVGLRRDSQAGDKLQKQIDNMKNDLDPNKARGGNLAKSQGMVNSAERVDTLFKQFPDYNVPANQSSELSGAIAGLINGGSAQSQHQIDSMTPSSFRGDANKIAGWLTNDPRGMEQQAFMKMMHETSRREGDLALSQVKRAQIQRLSAYDHLKAGPGAKDYQSLLDSYGISPEDISKYGPKRAAAAGQAPGGAPPISKDDALAEAKRRGLVP